jgi:hypothetical protein
MANITINTFKSLGYDVCMDGPNIKFKITNNSKSIEIIVDQPVGYPIIAPLVFTKTNECFVSIPKWNTTSRLDDIMKTVVEILCGDIMPTKEECGNIIINIPVAQALWRNLH